MTLLLVLVAGGRLHGVPFYENFNITGYTMKDGMPNNHVDDIFKDSHGFLWIAYQGGGLSRFDGYDFVNFADNSNVRHIRNSFVSSIAEDRFSRLWVSGDGGLDVVDLQTMSVTVPRDDSGRFDSVARTSSSSIMLDSTGALWVAGPDCLHRIAFDESGAVKTIDSLPLTRIYHRGVAIVDIEGDGQVWLGHGGTVNRVRVKDDGHLVPVPVSDKLVSLPGVEWISDFKVIDGQVWITTNNGLFRYDVNSDRLKHYVSDPGNSRTLSQNFLTDISTTSNHRILVSSLRGLNVYDPITDDFERAGEGSRVNIDNQFINMMLVDGEDILLGTEGGGIILLSPRRLKLHSIGHSYLNPLSPSYNPVNAVAESADGQSLWIGTVEGGLSVKL